MACQPKNFLIMNNIKTNASRKLLLLVILVAFSAMAVPGVFARGANDAIAQNKQDFTLHNETGQEITEVYVSPTGVDDWEEDILGTDTLPNGESVAISFSRRKENMWDIKVVFRNGKNSVWTKLNLSQITDVTLSFKNGKPWATWKNGDE
jgi:hypothetical protein